jgi:hypothetical protein
VTAELPTKLFWSVPLFCEFKGNYGQTEKNKASFLRRRGNKRKRTKKREKQGEMSPSAMGQRKSDGIVSVVSTKVKKQVPACITVYK